MRVRGDGDEGEGRERSKAVSGFNVIVSSQEECGTMLYLPDQ